MASPASVVIFQKTLQDLVKGIRGQRKDASSYISRVIAEIKTELRSTDQFTKAEAVRKLTYLQMIGYDISFASFAIVEVMSSARFAHKRIGFLAASQSFNDSTDVILLTTNLFKKEFTSMSHTPQTMYEIGLAVNCLANVVTKDLARDCIGDVAHLMSSPEPYVRKKAVLAMFKLFVQFPQGLRLTFEQLKSRLEDDNSSVVSSAVNVICELANRNPRNYIGMAPVFFRLLTTSSNNWMLIKVVKLFGSLVSEEPRLARKLLDPLVTIITTTSAKSLQFECISTVTLALPHTRREDGTEAKNAGSALKVCSSFIRDFIKDEDQNLKYLGLVGLINLMKVSPLVAVEHRDLVLKCLADDDMTIKSRALDLLAGMVTKKSLVDLVQHLLQHAQNTDGPYREEIVSNVLIMCTKDKHGLVSDFAWYISILCSLSRLSNSFARGSKHVALIAEELVEITLRVESVRPFAVESMISLLLDEEILASQQRMILAKILSSAAWIVGEYAAVLTNIYHDNCSLNERRFYIEGPFDKELVSNWRGQFIHYVLMRALLHPLVGACLPSDVQAAYMNAAMKIFVAGVSSCDQREVESLVALLRVRFGDSNNQGTFAQSANFEVEERKSFFLQLFYDLHILFPAEHDSAAVGDSNDLIEFSHRNDRLADLDSSQINEDDKIGASSALHKTEVLEALFSEPFYPVHAKAQRNVPVPPDLNMKAAFNSQELDTFINGTQDRNKPMLASLSFVSISESRPFVATGYGNSYANDHYAIDKASNYEEASKISKVLGDVSSSDYASSTSATPLNAAAPHSSSGGPSKPDDNQMFYLNTASAKAISSGAPMQYSDTNRSYAKNERQTRIATDATPLSELLASGHDDALLPLQSKRKHGKKSKTSGKERSSKHSTMLTREVAPAGELVSSEDEKSKRNNKQRDDNSDEESDLRNIDITMPLRPDEVIPVQKHREGSSDQTMNNENREHRTRENDKKISKKSKKDRHQKSNRDEVRDSLEDSNTKFFSGDLLGLECGVSTSLISPPVTLEDNEHVLEAVSSSKQSKKSKKKDALLLWRTLPLPGVMNVRAFYHIFGSLSSDLIEIQLFLVNDSLVSSGNSVSFQGRVDGASNIITISDVKAGKSAVSSKVGMHMSARRSQSRTLLAPLAAKISFENLLGSSDILTVSTYLPVPSSIIFRPFEVNDGEFADIISSRGGSKGCSFYGSTSGIIHVMVNNVHEESVSKYILKALAALLGGYVVHRDGSKAITVCSRANNTDILCCLFKFRDFSNGEYRLNVDVKYMSTAESVDVNGCASDILTSLNNTLLG